MAQPKEHRLEVEMCWMLKAHGLPLPDGYSISKKGVSRTKEINGDEDYTVRCLQLAMLERLADDLRFFRRWAVISAVLVIIAEILSIFF